MLVFKFLWYKEKKDFNYRIQRDVITEGNSHACFLWEWSQNGTRRSSHFSPRRPLIWQWVIMAMWPNFASEYLLLGILCQTMVFSLLPFVFLLDLWPICDILGILAIHIQITYFLGDKITSRFSVVWPLQQNKLITVLIIVTNRELIVFCCLISCVINCCI